MTVTSINEDDNKNKSFSTIMWFWSVMGGFGKLEKKNHEYVTYKYASLTEPSSTFQNLGHKWFRKFFVTFLVRFYFFVFASAKKKKTVAMFLFRWWERARKKNRLFCLEIIVEWFISFFVSVLRKYVIMLRLFFWFESLCVWVSECVNFVDKQKKALLRNLSRGKLAAVYLLIVIQNRRFMSVLLVVLLLD